MSRIKITIDDELLAEIRKAIKEAVREQLPLMKENLQSEWLSTEQAMEMLNVSRRTLQNYRDDGKLSYTQSGRKILYPREGIDTFLERNMTKAYR